jgi:hypothetical protein
MELNYTRPRNAKPTADRRDTGADGLIADLVAAHDQMGNRERLALRL